MYVTKHHMYGLLNSYHTCVQNAVT